MWNGRCGHDENPAGPGLTANGNPCGRKCAPGFTRCNLHGGSNPAAKIKAEQAMAQARLPAVETLFRIIEQFEANICAACGYPRGDADEKRMVIAACKTVLDRSGMGPHATLEITKQTDGDVDLRLLTETERTRMLEAIAVVKQLKRVLIERTAQAVITGTIKQVGSGSTSQP